MEVVELYKQLIAAQEARGQLMRWKLVVIAGIGAPALGFSGARPQDGAHLALAIIPLACLYIDILCRDLSIRAKRVSIFLSSREHGDEVAKAFESFYQARKDGASLESYALVGSTVVASVIVCAIGWILSGRAHGDVFALSAAVGLLGSAAVHALYTSRLALLRDTPPGMVAGEGTEVIRRSPRDIYEFVLDLERYKQADHKIGTVHSVSWHGDHGEIHYSGRFRGLPTPAVRQLITARPYSRIDVKSKKGTLAHVMSRFHGSFTFEQLPDGATRVHHREELVFPPALAWLGVPLLKSWLKRDTPQEMLRLKKLLEDGSEVVAG